MDKKEIFENFDNDINTKLIDKYKGETDISKILDISRFKDNIDGLIEEITKQPAVYAYWANLKRIADEIYDNLNKKFEDTKSRYYKSVYQTLKSDGVKNPTTKAVDKKFIEMYGEEIWYKKFLTKLKIWRKRSEQLKIIEKAIASRENSFRSLSYLLGNMMNQGIYHPKNNFKRS